MGDVSSEGEISGYAGIAGKFKRAITDLAVGTFYPEELQKKYAKEHYGDEGKAVEIAKKASDLQSMLGISFAPLAVWAGIPAAVAGVIYIMVDGCTREIMARHKGRAYGISAVEVPWRLVKAEKKAVRYVKNYLSAEREKDKDFEKFS